MTATDSTPTTGTEISSLSTAGKDELEALNLGRYVSTLPWRYSFRHANPVYRGAGDNSVYTFFANQTSLVAWHSDVSYEQQPHGTTVLYISNKPKTGSNTLFVDALQKSPAPPPLPTPPPK